MNPDVHEDAVFATLEALPAYDVSSLRIQRLRRRCHTVLRAKTPPADGSSSPQTIGPVLLGAGCVLYLIETVRLAVHIDIF
jgi:hypothetical protein